jgi:uncharacterized protein (DUF3084 family)
LDSKVEKIAELDSIHQQARGQVSELDAGKSILEQRLVQADLHVRHLEQEVQAGRQREDIARQNLVALQQDYERLQVLCKSPSPL